MPFQAPVGARRNRAGFVIISKTCSAWERGVFGLSTQDTDYQREVVERLHLPFELLGDAELTLARLLRLPTFEVEGMLLIKRLTLIIADGRIEKVLDPVFPPDANAAEVIAWLSAHPWLCRDEVIRPPEATP